MTVLNIFLIALVALLAGLTVFLAVYYFAKRPQDTTQKRFVWCCALAAVAAFLLVFVGIFCVVLYQFLADKGESVQKISLVLMYVAVPVVLVVACLLIASVRLNLKQQDKESLFTTKNLVRMAVFTSLSLVLYLVAKFPLPLIFPSFLDIQISDMPALLAGFTMGTGAGSIVIILRTLVKLPMTGTGGVGELGDLILGLVYVVVSSQIYKLFKSKKGAILALSVGSIAVVVVSVIINRLILIPFYTSFMFPWEALLGMVKPLYPSVTKDSFYTYYLWLAVVPFNLLRCIITSLVTFFLYKPTRRIFAGLSK